MELGLGTTTIGDDLAEVEDWLPVTGFPDYEVSDMGRVRCLVDRKGGHKAPFILTATLSAAGRPTVTLRNAAGQKVRRVDELVLEAFTGPRPAPDWGPTALNGDRQDVRPNNLAWSEGLIKTRNTKRRKATKTAKKTPVAKLPKEIRHGHWLGIGNVTVSIQPNNLVELTVDDTQDHHSISVGDLDDVIRILQAARTIIAS